MKEQLSSREPKKEGEWEEKGSEIGFEKIIKDTIKLLEAQQQRLLEVAVEAKDLAMQRVRVKQERQQKNLTKKRNPLK